MEQNENSILTNLLSDDILEVIKGIQDFEKCLLNFEYQLRFKNNNKILQTIKQSLSFNGPIVMKVTSSVENEKLQLLMSHDGGDNQ
jgi:hypothetical protein